MSDKLPYKVGESQGCSPPQRLGSPPWACCPYQPESGLGSGLGAPGTPKIAGLASQVPGGWSPRAAES